MSGSERASLSILAGLLSLIVIVDSVPKYLEGRDVSKLTLTYIGAVDGKSMFVEETVRANWTQAWTYCNELNLKLASIQTESQVEFLEKHLNDTRVYWTSARENRAPTSFIWDSSDTKPNATLFKEWFQFSTSVQYHYCAVTYPFRGRLYMSTRHCSSSYYGIICEN